MKKQIASLASGTDLINVISFDEHDLEQQKATALRIQGLLKRATDLSFDLIEADFAAS